MGPAILGLESASVDTCLIRIFADVAIGPAQDERGAEGEDNAFTI